MTRSTLTHRRLVRAPADELYRLVADVTWWPVIFGPCVHVTHLDRTDTTERFRMWALVNGSVTRWTSRRELDPRGLRVRFEQERSHPPVAAMGGEWSFHARPGGRTEIVLDHSFHVTGGAAEHAAVAAGVDANSERELAALDRIATIGPPVSEVLFEFTDTVPLDGDSGDAFAFVNASDRWPELLPHVQRVVLTEDPPGVQDMTMDTVTPGGGTHTTRSIRLCFPPDRIVYKQLAPPALLLGHSGTWDFTGGPGPARVTATHRVAIDTDRVDDLIGPGSTPADARAWLRHSLGANSRTTLAAAVAARPAGR